MLTAFLVVFGTLMIQGFTLKPLLHALKLRDSDPVAAEEARGRERMLQAAFGALPDAASPAVQLVRKNLKMQLGRPLHDGNSAFTAFGVEYDRHYFPAIAAARASLLAMRRSGEIGDDAFHTLENDLDWMEVSDPLRAANADATG